MKGENMKTLTNILKGGAIAVISFLAYILANGAVPKVLSFYLMLEQQLAQRTAPMGPMWHPQMGRMPPGAYYDTSFWELLIFVPLAHGIPVAIAYFTAYAISKETAKPAYIFIPASPPLSYSIFPLSFLILLLVVLSGWYISIPLWSTDIEGYVWYSYETFFAVLAQITRLAVSIICLKKYLEKDR